uniref:BTB domain-containing protein n=1 Tax=Meloidogyne incognita TaxID=6306 RepID=A0A914NDI0_MELIC
MFEQKNMKEARSGRIKIVDSSPECFKAMLEYFYSGEIDKKTIEKYSEDLFSVAHKYEVKQLMQICENYMAANIDATNFGKRCSYAELYRLPKLEKACFNYFSSKRGTFILSKEWNNFKTNNKDFAFRLLEDKQIFGEKIGK